MKLFRTNDVHLKNYCQLMFQIVLSSIIIKRRLGKVKTRLHITTAISCLLLKIFSSCLFKIVENFAAAIHSVYIVNLGTVPEKLVQI